MTEEALKKKNVNEKAKKVLDFQNDGMAVL
jgi:hypothetical protein